MAYPSLTTNDAAQAGMAATGVGAITSAIGSLQYGEAAASADKYQGQIALNNAAIAKKNASTVGEEGEISAGTQGLKNRSNIGSITANQGANGVDVNSGSAVDVRKSADLVGQMDAMTIRSNAAREAYGYQTQASNFKGEAGLKASEATDALSSSYLGASSSLLGGASSLGKQYAAWQQSYGSGGSGGAGGAGGAYTGDGNGEFEPIKATLAGE